MKKSKIDKFVLNFRKEREDSLYDFIDMFKSKKASGKVEMPASEAVEEHEHLVAVLESPSHKDDKKEAKKQKKELKEYKKQVRKSITDWINQYKK